MLTHRSTNGSFGDSPGKVSFVSFAGQQRSNIVAVSVEADLTNDTNVSMVFCGPHLSLPFHFVCGPGEGGATKNMESKRV